jgi:hypothetical protein
MWNSWSTVSSPWKMLPPIRPHSSCICFGPDDLAVHDRVLEVRRHVVHALDQPVGVASSSGAWPSSSPSSRHPLREHRHHVHALGRERLVDTVGIAVSLNGSVAGLPEPRLLERLSR